MSSYLANRPIEKQKIVGIQTYFSVVVNDLDPFPFGRNDPSADGYIEFSFGTRFDPNIITL